MKTILAVSVIFTLALATLGASSAWADSPNPLSHLDKQKRGNISPHTDDKKKLSPKSFSYVTSKVCGLDFCKGKEQKSALKTQADGGGYVPTWAKNFDGKITIKGYFPRK